MNKSNFNQLVNECDMRLFGYTAKKLDGTSFISTVENMVDDGRYLTLFTVALKDDKTAYKLVVEIINLIFTLEAKAEEITKSSEFIETYRKLLFFIWKEEFCNIDHLVSMCISYALEILGRTDPKNPLDFHFLVSYAIRSCPEQTKAIRELVINSLNQLQLE